MGKSASKVQLESKKIVIIGGGYGGIQMASNFKKSGLPFTLVDPKQYFHHNIAAGRAAVNYEGNY
jgi:NADH dehydrogenase FAD-containing subunit